ncbi:MAG: GNAT family N-acetyltransferase [Acidobacteriota bacterium]
MVTVVPARAEHGAGVAAVAEAVRFRPETARGSEGYLVYVASAAEYARRLGGSAYSVVAVEEGRVVGFLRALGSGEADWSVEHGAMAGGLPLEGYVLIDQIGVLPAYQGLGLAQKMLDAVAGRSGAARMGAMILHAPLRNARSLGFFTGRKGFVLVREAAEPPFVWGYYEKSLTVVS